MTAIALCTSCSQAKNDIVFILMQAAILVVYMSNSGLVYNKFSSWSSRSKTFGQSHLDLDSLFSRHVNVCVCVWKIQNNLTLCVCVGGGGGGGGGG